MRIVISQGQEARKQPLGEKSRSLIMSVCHLEDIAAALPCNFPYLEAQKIHKKSGLLEENEMYS